MAAVDRVRRALGRGANALAFVRAAPFYARYTVRYHLPAEMLMGLYAGVVLLADIVARKTLRASDWMLTLQSSVPTMTMILAMVWRDVLAGRNRRRVLVMTGFLGKGLLVFVAFITRPGPFLGLIILFAVVDSAFIPLRNSIFRANYDEKVRGRLFGGVVALMNLALVAANLAAAWALARWEESYRILFPLAGLIGLAAHVIYSRVRLRGDAAAAEGESAATGGTLLSRIRGPLVRAFATTIRILREDRRFRRYEGAFFIYGLAFLMNLPLVVMLIVDEIDLPYDQAAMGRFVVGQVMMILLSGFAGRLLDRSHPAKMMAGACVLLAVHATLLSLTTGFWWLFSAYLVYGVAMTAVNLGWNLGPLKFAPSERESTDYMAVHVTLTGLRGMLGPVIALAAKRLFGLRPAFAVSALLFLVAAVLMATLSRQIRAEARPGA